LPRDGSGEEDGKDGAPSLIGEIVPEDARRMLAKPLAAEVEPYIAQFAGERATAIPWFQRSGPIRSAPSTKATPVPAGKHTGQAEDGNSQHREQSQAARGAKHHRGPTCESSHRRSLADAQGDHKATFSNIVERRAVRPRAKRDREMP